LTSRRSPPWKWAGASLSAPRGWQLAHQVLGLPQDRVVIHGPRRRQDQPFGPVMRRREGPEILAPERRYPLGRPQDRAADGLPGIGHFLQPVEDDVVGRIQRLPDLLQDHPALDLDLVRIEDRVQDDVGHDIQREAYVGLEHPGVVGRHLAPRVGVDVAAHVLDRLSDLQRRPPLGPLERHVFQEMRDAVLLGRFVPAACQDPDADGRGFQPWHGFGHHAQAVGQGIEADSHRVRRLRIRVSMALRSFGTSVTRSGR